MVGDVREDKGHYAGPNTTSEATQKLQKPKETKLIDIGAKPIDADLGWRTMHTEIAGGNGRLWESKELRC